MTSSMNDDNLLSLVGEALADDGPPPDAIEAAHAAFGWRTLDLDLARLIEDQQVEVVGFHNAAFSRLISYETDFGTIEVSIDNDLFQVGLSPAAKKVVLDQPLGRRELPIDASGRASASGVSGSIRFEVTWAEGSAVTPWLTL